LKPRVGVIGVGAMGMGVAKALLAKGFTVVVRDIVPEREVEAVAAGARRAPTPAEVASQVDVLVTLVVDAAQTREVLSGLDRPGVVMMCSTIAPADAEAISTGLHARGVPMLDAPISGGPARAHSGTLSMMAAGTDDAFARARAVIEATTSKCFRIGARPGDGSRMKIVNNMLAAANLAAGCEAMVAAARLGLDLHQAADVINASSGASWIFADRMPRALAGDYAPRAAARVLKKDISLFVEEARALRVDAPMAETASRVFMDTVERGLGEEDDAAVLKRYAALAGVALPG
jgi:3-hydroxyisobutyrate dehydrogenase-like beta-hydroxyacid dehydrogenase